MNKKVRHINKRNNVLTNKQKLLFIIVSAILVSCIFLSWIIIRRNKKILDVAYYRLPQAVTDSLTRQIKKSYSGKIRFRVLPEDTVLSQNKAKRYDLFFLHGTGRRLRFLRKKQLSFPLHFTIRYRLQRENSVL